MDNEVKAYFQIHSSSRGLNRSEIDEISRVATLREYEAGQVVVEHGEPANVLSLVISGHFTMHPSGDSIEAVGFLGANDQIGTMEIVQDRVAPLRVVAVEPSLVIEIEETDVHRLMSENSIFARNLLGKASVHMTQMAIDGGASHVPRRIAFLHIHSDTLAVSTKIQRRLCEIGESLGRIVNEDSRFRQSRLSQCESMFLPNDGSDQRPAIREQLAKWTELERVVFDINFENIELQIESLHDLFSFPERVFLLVTPEGANEIAKQLQSVLAKNPSWKDKLNLIWVLDEKHDVAPLVPELLAHVSRDFKVKVSDSVASSDVFFQRTAEPGIERVVHYLRGVQVGVALGGGAARGMSHLGVLKAMDESGIVIDAIAGTSVGAMIGVSYCVGYSPDNSVERFTKTLTPRGIFRWITMGDHWYMLMKYRTHGWESMLRDHFYDWHLEQMLVPLTTIAADLIKAEEFVRNSGDGVLGVMESINLGGIATPICRDGMALVDGGYLNNVPADTLVRRGANFVISVDVSATIPHTLAGNTPDTPTARMKIPRIHQVLSRIREVAQKNLRRMGGSHANFVIAPDVSAVSFSDFKSTPKTAEVGYRTAQEAMPRLKSQLYRLDPHLFPFRDNADESGEYDNVAAPAMLRRTAG